MNTMTRAFYYEGLQPSWADIKREVEKKYPGYKLEDYDYERIGDLKGTDMQEYHNVYCGSKYWVTVKLSDGTPCYQDDWRDRALFQGR